MCREVGDSWRGAVNRAKGRRIDMQGVRNGKDHNVYRSCSCSKSQESSLQFPGGNIRLPVTGGKVACIR